MMVKTSDRTTVFTTKEDANVADLEPWFINYVRCVMCLLS